MTLQSTKFSYLDQREDLNDEVAAFINKNTPGSNQGHNAEKPHKGIMSITSKIITVTPDEARKYLGNMVNNRPVSQFAVKTYVSEMTNGRWGITGQGIIFDTKGRLLDGQHRMHAVVKSGVTIQTTATYGVDPDMFSLLDGGNKRSASDVLGCKNSTCTAAALKLLFQELNGNWSCGNRSMRPQDALAMFERFPAIQESATYVAGNSGLRKVLPSGQAAYCHYRCGIDAPDRRENFFVMLSTGANLGARSPVLALRNSLAHEQGKILTMTARVSSFIRAWRLHLDNRQVGFLRVTADLPQWEKALV